MNWVVENWDILVGLSSAVLALATGITKLTPSPKDDEIVKKIVGFFSVVEHLDVGGFKSPLKPAKKAREE